tara:strand:- start:448 stop:723 length:276 start_codon:yes stop_codon:yes gene_type:complete
MPLDNLTFNYGERYTIGLGFKIGNGAYIGRLNRMFMFIGRGLDNTPELYFVGLAASRFISVNKGSLELREDETEYLKGIMEKHLPKLAKTT